MFGKRKKIETPATNSKNYADQNIPFQAAAQEQEEIEEQEPEPVKQKLKARIISCKYLDSGLIEYVFWAQGKMGELGEEFDL
jgi:hypothetical protein